MKRPSVIRRTVARGVFLLAAGAAFAQGVPDAATPIPPPGGTKPASPPLWLRELWVPADDLDPVLSRFPRAVPLDHDQLFTLLRDAHAADPAAPDPANAPPERAVLRQASFDAWPVSGPDARPQLQVQAELEVEVFSDAWADVPLGLPGVALGTAEIDDPGAPVRLFGPIWVSTIGAHGFNVVPPCLFPPPAPGNVPSALGRNSLRRLGDGPDAPAGLRLQGRGVHLLALEFLLPVDTTGLEGNSIGLPQVDGVGEFTLHLPAGTRADSNRGCAVEAEGAGVVARVALGSAAGGSAPHANEIRDFLDSAHLDAKRSPAPGPDRLNWRTPPPATDETNAVLQDNRVEATVEESRVAVQQAVVLHPALGRLPAEARFTLPAGARAVRVEGAAGRWDVGADGVRVMLTPDGEGGGTENFTVLYELALNLDPQGAVQRIGVPVLEAAGAHRVTGPLAVSHGRGVQVHRIEPGAVATPVAGGSIPAALEAVPGFVAGFALADLPAPGPAAPPVALTVEARRATARFSVDADARVDFQPDGVTIQHTLAFRVEEGEVFTARVRLPPGETLLALAAAPGSDAPDWRQEGSDLLLTWNAGLAEATKTVLTLDTRADLVPPSADKPSDTVLGAVLVPGAERLTGYVALTNAPALRLVTTGGEEALERRDGRTTPAQGNVAWFYRENYHLALRVERRTAETEARFTGYALPLAGAVEVHAQMDYRFLYSGVETVKVRVPAESADAFFFTGEHIAERHLDGDVWTVRFQDEQHGNYTLGVQATIPAPPDRDDAQRFHFRLPMVVPLESARWSGEWAVEANTDTEIRFTTAGANEVDTLDAPTLAGYQPRRRVIGVFEFLGGAADARVELDGAHHPAAGVAAAVVDRLELETVASTSGVARHRATLRARTAGDGFFDVRLPPGAALWSLTRDGQPIKPVVGAAGELRVELPGGREPSNASTVVAVYETPGQPWTASGRRMMAAPGFDPGVPVLQSHWKLYLPDGFDYRFSDLPPGAATADVTAPGDLLLPRVGLAFGRAAAWVLGRAGSAASRPAFLETPEPPAISAMQDLSSEDAVIHQDDARAVKEYRDAVDALPDTPANADHRRASMEKFADASVKFADRLVAEGRYVDAETVLKVVLRPEYNPRYRPAIIALQHLEDPEYYNQTLKAKSINPVQKVRDLLTEAKGFYDANRYDLAFQRYEQVLTLDPYNNAARRGEELVDLAKKSHGGSGNSDETRGRVLGDVSQDWGLPVRKGNPETAPRNEGARQRDDVGTASIQRKLASIIIPSIEFHSTTISDAIEFLRQESRRLDTDPDPEARGVNIFLKLPRPEPASSPEASASPIPGLPPGAETGGIPSPTSNTRITLTLKRIPLLEALKYVASQAGLKTKVESYAVSIAPVSEQTDVMVTADFKVPPGFITQGQNALTHQDAKTILEASGVVFPPGASATYLPRTGKLVVRNTQENIDLVESLVTENQSAIPQAASAPSMTILPSDKADGSMATLEIGNLAPGILGNTATSSMRGVGGTADVSGAGSVTIARQDAKTFLEANGVTFPPGASATYLPGTGKLVIRNTKENIDLITSLAGVPAGAPNGVPVTAGDRSGTFGISANAIDALLFGGAGATPPPGIFSVAGVFTDPQFRLRQGDGNQDRIAGLLPLKLDLPANGRAYEFEDGGEPRPLDFHYTDWRTAARGQWMFLTLGALGFLMLAAGGTRPWRRTFYAALALTFLPLIVAPSVTVSCNALLAGWLWAVFGWCVTRFLRHRQRLAMMLLCAGALMGSLVPGAPGAEPTPTPTPGPAPELVIVPYDATKPMAGQQPPRYYLPYERFLTLWDAAKRHRRPSDPEPPPGGERYDVFAARYDVRLVGEALEIVATLDLRTFGDGGIFVPLWSNTVQVGGVSLDGAPATLDDRGQLWVGTPGAHRLNASLHLAAGTISAGTRLSWQVPRSEATLVTLLLPRAGLRAEIQGGNTPGGTGEVEEITPEGRRLIASVGGTKKLELSFLDAPPPATVTDQPTLASIVARLVAGTRSEAVSADVNFSFPGNTQNHFRVLLDPGLTLTGLDAPAIKQWHLTTAGNRQTLDVTLNTPARDAYHLALQADRPPVTTLPEGRRNFPLVSAEARRVRQTDALYADGAVEISLPDGPPPGAQRVDNPPSAEGRPFAAFESNGFAEVVYNVRPTTEKRTAHIDYLYQVGHGKIELATRVRLVPAAGSGPLLTADLRLPPGFAVQTVAGEAVGEWWREGDVLSLRFKPGTGQGEVALVIDLVRQFDHAPDSFALQPLVAAGFSETDGQAVVAADRSFKVGLTLPTGVRAHDLSEIDPATAAAEYQVGAPLERQRAFRYLGAAFDVTATLEAQPARWQAQWVTRATLREGVMAWETRVNVEARQGAVDALEFSLPAGTAEARVSGADVRETLPAVGNIEGRRTYRVLLQDPLYAGREAAFTVGLELPLGADGRAAVPDLAFTGHGGGQAADGFLLVENASSGEMTLDARGLEPAIGKDVPFLPAQIVAGTRFYRAAPGVPWSLGVQVSGLEKTAGRAALVAYAELTSTLRADGEEWHRATYRLQNRRLQYLPVELPPGVELIGARVAGENVRVDAGPGGKAAPLLLVPLLKTRPGELSYDVEVVYRRPAPGSGAERRGPFFSHWQLDAPRLPDLPVEKTLWNVWLPVDARLLSSGGNLMPVVGALTETEKLESELSDLRSLSATYGSAGASTRERTRALANFQTLATGVEHKLQMAPAGRVAKDGEITSLFRQPNIASQNAVVDQKQQSILRELGSLNEANALSQQNPVLTGSGSNTYRGTTDINAGTLAIDGRLLLGTRSEGAVWDSRASDSDSLVSHGPTGTSSWRDNRVAGQRQPSLTGDGTVMTGDKAAPPSQVLRPDQFALNDSLSVDLPTAATAVTLDQNRSDAFGSRDSRMVNRSSAARAPARQTAPEPADSQAQASAPSVADSARAVPVQPAAPPNAMPPASPTELRTERLHSVGRISLNIDFPQEGQVYHFKKINADAHLTLWSAWPGRFVQLGWLTFLVAGGVVMWTIRRSVRWLVTARRRPAAQPA